MPGTVPSNERKQVNSPCAPSRFISIPALGLVICPFLLGIIGSFDETHDERLQQAYASLQDLRNGIDLGAGTGLTADGRLNNITLMVEAQAEVIGAMLSKSETSSKEDLLPLLFVLSVPVLSTWCFCVEKFVKLSPATKRLPILIFGAVAIVPGFLLGLVFWEGHFGSFLQAFTLAGSLGLFWGYVKADEPQ
ncbi:MAG: hypothetical protein M1812_002814 [Candelaria pacifica]|nr:MAG: hypothetical protein M1812_002814 [Candelaria pacifica]